MPVHLTSRFMQFINDVHDPHANQLGLKSKKHVAETCKAEIDLCLELGATWRPWARKTTEQIEAEHNGSKSKGWRVGECVLQLYNRTLPDKHLAKAGNRTVSARCANETGLGFRPRMRQMVAERDCVDGSYSELGRAGDTNIQVIYDSLRKRQLVWYRRDFGTWGGWREIRGVQAVSLQPRISDCAVSRQAAARLRRKRKLAAKTVPKLELVSSFYLDRLGKLERYRRQGEPH